MTHWRARWPLRKEPRRTLSDELERRAWKPLAVAEDLSPGPPAEWVRRDLSPRPVFRAATSSEHATIVELLLIPTGWLISWRRGFPLTRFSAASPLIASATGRCEHFGQAQGGRPPAGRGVSGHEAMYVLGYLKERIKFIGGFYETASGPFRETIRKIEAGEAPFNPPPRYDYDDGYGEPEPPPFLEEWMEVDTSLRVLGLACLSMLSASLKLYFETWERQLRVVWKPR